MLRIVVIISGINNAFKFVALHLCLRKLKHRKLTLGNRQDCKTEKGTLDNTPVYGVVTNPSMFPRSEIR